MRCQRYSCLLVVFFCSRFFAGGSERSGQQIVGPPKKKSTNEVVEDLFKGAKEHGAVPVDKAGKGLGESSKAKVLHTSVYRACGVNTRQVTTKSNIFLNKQHHHEHSTFRVLFNIFG